MVKSSISKFKVFIYYSSILIIDNNLHIIVFLKSILLILTKSLTTGTNTLAVVMLDTTSVRKVAKLTIRITMSA